MTRIATILVASDFSPNARQAARRAALLAREHSARLKLLHVLSAPRVKELELRLHAPMDIEHSLLEDAQRSLDALAEEAASAAGSPIERQVIEGGVLDEILTAANAADLLVLGAHGLHPLRDLFIGSTAERLLMRSRRPMLVVKQDGADVYKSVLVPVDFSDHSIAALRFAQQVAPSADICVLHAFESPFEGKLEYAGVSQEIIARYREESGREARASMAALLERHADAQSRAVPVVAHGDPRTLIASKADELGADLIVIGKHGRSLLAEYFLGGITRAVLARAACDVAVVPEPGRARS